MMFFYMSISMHVFSSDHENRMKLYNELFHYRIDRNRKNNEAREHITSIKALSCMFLLLTPVSWKHVVTVPQQLQSPITFDESQAEKFVRTIRQDNQQQDKRHTR